MDKLLELGKDLKVKHSVSSPPTKYGGTFSLKSFAWGNKLFWVNFWGNVLLGGGTNDQIMQQGS